MGARSCISIQEPEVHNVHNRHGGQVRRLRRQLQEPQRGPDRTPASAPSTEGQGRASSTPRKIERERLTALPRGARRHPRAGRLRQARHGGHDSARSNTPASTRFRILGICLGMQTCGDRIRASRLRSGRRQLDRARSPARAHPVVALVTEWTDRSGAVEAPRPEQFGPRRHDAPGPPGSSRADRYACAQDLRRRRGRTPSSPL